MNPTTIAFVGLGGNVGDAAATLREALSALDRLPDTRQLRASRLYRTPAWGRVEQADFVNAAVKLETRLDARGLLDALLEVERQFGRERDDAQLRWGPRTLDLDLLLFGEGAIDEPGLRVPHPHLHERAFALVPLVEIEPEVVIPGHGTARSALAAVAARGIEALP
ncbi:2-amino-4-hydroxy-6-hydroxymethyldihydropteridine diphosphokinase [Luteimonas mephitis]|uniref:2-amino-4-hydroxy-6- hydroxymethyldihydropteridine diphosphokinase n=1 Tax=Luteimonas mephitis TaxID=83615 RepID=UPI003A90A3C9